MKQTDPQFKLRLPPALKDRLEKVAEEAGKTLTAEIVSRLEASFAPQAITTGEQQLRIAMHTNDAKAQTLRAHLYTVRTFLEALQTRERLARGEGAKPKEMEQLKQDIQATVADVARVSTEYERVVAEGHELEKLWQEEHRKTRANLDRIADRQIQPVLFDLHEFYETHNWPEDERKVHLVNPATLTPEERKRLATARKAPKPSTTTIIGGGKSTVIKKKPGTQ